MVDVTKKRTRKSLSRKPGTTRDPQAAKLAAGLNASIAASKTKRPSVGDGPAESGYGADWRGTWNEVNDKSAQWLIDNGGVDTRNDGWCLFNGSCIGRNTVHDFVCHGPGLVECLCGVMASKFLVYFHNLDAFEPLMDHNLRTDSIEVWYEAYAKWTREVYNEGEAAVVSRSQFVRRVHKEFGLGSGVSGKRAIIKGVPRQYRRFRYDPVFCGEDLSRRVTSAPASEREPEFRGMPGGVFRFMNYVEYRQRLTRLSDYLGYNRISDYHPYSAVRAITLLAAEQARKHTLRKSLRAFDHTLVYNHMTGHMCWEYKPLPKGVIGLEMSFPATGLKYPLNHGVDVRDETTVRLGLFLRTPDFLAPNTDLHETVGDGMMFGNHCLLGIGVTIIEPQVDPFTGELGELAEYYISSPTEFTIDQDGWTFDVDYLLKVLGDQVDVMQVVNSMRKREIYGTEVMASSDVWLAGEPRVPSAMNLDPRCYTTAWLTMFSEFEQATGKVGYLWGMHDIALRRAVLDDQYLETQRNPELYTVGGERTETVPFVAGDEYDITTGERTIEPLKDQMWESFEERFNASILPEPL